MQRLHPRQLSPSTPLSSSFVSPTISNNSITPSNTSPSSPSSVSPSTDALTYPVIGAVAGTVFILVCLTTYVAYQARVVNRERRDNVLLKNKNWKHYSPMDLKKGNTSRRGVQSNDNSSTLCSQLIHPSLLRSNLSPHPSPTPSPPPSYTRGPQCVILGIDQIENDKNNKATELLLESESRWHSSRSPQDHLKQEQLDRVLKLHRQQMEELQALLQRHMLDNTHLLAPHAIVDVDAADGDGESDGGIGVIGEGERQRRRGRGVGSGKQKSHQSSQFSSPGLNPNSQSPQGIDSPMVQPDDAVRGPEEFLYPVPYRAQGRPSLVTHGSLGLSSDWMLEEEEDDEREAGMEELRPEERSMLVDCFQKINAHYERQFRIAENEILHGSSSQETEQSQKEK